VADDPIKRPPTLDKLKFECQPMVRWLDPLELIQTGLRTAISTVFGEFADKRELQEALVHDVEERFPDYTKVGDLWLDFVADSGDGFESTYTIAYLLAQAELVLGDTGNQRLPRGNLLVMGGDQVYPTPSRRGYENRLLGPYEAALPGAKPQPDLYAIPGNHDWYDGLTNFLRFFCNDQSIGGWKTWQRRSYFAMKLTHNWWLWGIDIQFDAYIDEPQLRYFDRAARQFKGGERVLLVTGKPSWTDVKPKSPSYENLRYLEERIIESGGRVVRPEDRPSPAPTVPVMLTGDDHHYTRYQSNSDRHKLTAGGGGAFLSATHHLRTRVPLRRGYDDDAENVDYLLKMRYPSLRQSRRLAPATLWLLPRRNPWFIAAVLFAYFVPALLLQVPTTARAADPSLGFMDFLRLTALSEWTAYAGAVLFVVLVLYAAVESPFWRMFVAAVHAVAHVMLLAVFVAGAARICHWLAWQIETGWLWWFRENIFEADLTVAIVGALLAALPGTILVALYLVVMDSFSRTGRNFARHSMELFAAQQRTGYKNFLRIHISHETGAMTIYPICVPRAAKFEFRTGGTGDEPFFKPTKPIEWGLIEQPIVIGGKPRTVETLSGKNIS
jgi:hypothetical protein